MKKTVEITKEGKKELEDELKSRVAEREVIIEKIATARAFGDLSENEEYSAARAEQKINEHRIAEIEEILKTVNETLDTPTITALNAKVDVDKEEYEDVAEEYWESIRQQ